MDLFGAGSVSCAAAQGWARSTGAHQRYVDVAPLYWSIAPRYGVPPEGPYGQAAKETNRGHYTGVVPWEYHNWCGLKTTAGGSNSDARAHMRFGSDADGVLAHVQHWARYGGATAPAPGDALLDTRWQAVAWTIATVEEMGGKWAPSASYGTETAGVIASIRAYARAHPEMRDPQIMATQYDNIFRSVSLVDARAQLEKRAPGAGGVERGPYETIPLDQKRGIVIHYRGVVTGVTDGLASYRADAIYHVGKNWSRNGETPVYGSGIMYHIGIDGQGAVYLLRDLNRVLWHCGAWPQNANTMAIQIPLGGSQRATDAQLAALDRVCDDWFAFTGADPKRELWGHQELSPTDCPGTLMADFVRPYRAGGPQPAPQPPAAVTAPDPWRSPHGTFWVPTAFIDHISARPWLDTGYALGGAREEGGVLVQYFERARLELQPDGTVTRGLVGAELLELRRDRPSSADR